MISQTLMRRVGTPTAEQCPPAIADNDSLRASRSSIANLELRLDAMPFKEASQEGADGGIHRFPMKYSGSR